MDLIWLFAAGCCVMVLTYYGSLGTLVDRISVDGGGRYYYVPQAVFGLVVLGLAATCHDIVAKLSWVVVVWLAAEEYLSMELRPRSPVSPDPWMLFALHPQRPVRYTRSAALPEARGR